jgi:hypothetical protein
VQEEEEEQEKSLHRKNSESFHKNFSEGRRSRPLTMEGFQEETSVQKFLLKFSVVVDWI